MATAPNIENYQIPTGKVYFREDGDSDFRDLGNCVSMSVSNEIEQKEHFRNYGGRRTKDRTDITQVGATVGFTLDEVNAENIAFFAMAVVDFNSDGGFSMKGLSKTQFKGTLRVIGDNSRGPKLNWEGDVSFIPTADFSFIKDNDDYNTIQIEADVQADDDGEFGTWSGTEGE